MYSDQQVWEQRNRECDAWKFGYRGWKDPEVWSAQLHRRLDDLQRDCLDHGQRVLVRRAAVAGAKFAKRQEVAA